MKRFKADLHIHTALSPCAMEEMTPPAIAREAVCKGLQMIAVCDHNAAGNAASTQEAAGTTIAVIAGMEVTTAEDIHVIGLFPDTTAACAAADIVRASLPPLSDRARRFGQQLLMSAEGRILGTDPKMLSASSGLTLYETVNLIKSYKGLAITAHVNRPSFSVISQLGLFPMDAGFDAIEVCTKPLSPPWCKKDLPEELPIVNSSDSHFLSDIGSCFTTLQMAESSFSELTFAIKEISGRRCCDA